MSVARYRSANPGRFLNLSGDFSSYINAFKAVNADIVTGVLSPPDFAGFENSRASRACSPRS